MGHDKLYPLALLATLAFAGSDGAAQPTSLSKPIDGAHLLRVLGRCLAGAVVKT